MILKLKAFIYQKTGIYLAQKEEDAHMNSLDTMKEIARLTALDEDGLDEDTVRGILIGSWQAQHGFYREWKDVKNFWDRESQMKSEDDNE